LGQLKNGSAILYKELIFSQPQPDSELDIQQNRRVAPSFYFDFREHILKQFNTSYQINPNVNCQSINILFLVRHNYVAHPRNPSGRITRQLSNEKEILSFLKMKFSKYSNINFSSNHFEHLNIQEQLNIIVQTDIFIGMHGAGLTHVLFLKSNRTLIELSSTFRIATHYDFMSSINNVNYHQCSITDGEPTTAQMIFDCIRETLVKMCPSVTTSTNITSSA
jgi:glycoprotein 2-beta-D-xylosyltransferase